MQEVGTDGILKERPDARKSGRRLADIELLYGAATRGKPAAAAEATAAIAKWGDTIG